MADRRPTILQIVPELDTGGAEMSTLEISEALIAAGGRAIVLSEGGRLVARLEAMGANVRLFPAATKNPVRMVDNARRIARMVRQDGVDLMHARSRAPAWSTLWASRATGCPFITTYHGGHSENSAIKKLYNSIMVRGRVVIANSDYTAALIRSRYGTPDAQIRVVHRGVDGSRFDPDRISPERVQSLRDAWGVKDGERIVLKAARLSARKGQSVVVEAVRALKAEGRLLEGVVVVLAGDAQGRDDYEASLRQAIRSGGLEGSVRLVGHVEDMPAAFRAADVSVVASIEPEGFGRTSVESQALGCPVIVTSVGALPETVLSPPGHGPATMTGWLVPPGDPKAMADALVAALNLGPAERAALGARARAHACGTFSLEQMRLKTLRVYDEILGTRLAAAYVAARPQIEG